MEDKMSKYDQDEAQIRELIEQRAADLRAGNAERIVARSSRTR